MPDPADPLAQIRALAAEIARGPRERDDETPAFKAER